MKKSKLIFPIMGTIITVATVIPSTISCGTVSENQINDSIKAFLSKSNNQYKPSEVKVTDIHLKSSYDGATLKVTKITPNDAYGTLDIEIEAQYKGKKYTIKKTLSGFKTNGSVTPTPQPQPNPNPGTNPNKDDKAIEAFLQKLTLNVSKDSYYDIVTTGKTTIKKEKIENKKFVRLLDKTNLTNIDDEALTSNNVKDYNVQILEPEFDDANHSITIKVKYTSKVSNKEVVKEYKETLRKSFKDDAKTFLDALNVNVPTNKDCWEIVDSNITVNKDASLPNSNFQYSGLFIGYTKNQSKKTEYDKSLAQAKEGKMPVVFKFKDKTFKDSTNAGVTAYYTHTFENLQKHTETTPTPGNSLEDLAKNGTLFKVNKSDSNYKTEIEKIKSQFKSGKWGYIIIAGKNDIKYGNQKSDAQKATSSSWLTINENAPSGYTQIKASAKKGSQTAPYFSLENGKVVIKYKLSKDATEIYTAQLED